MRNRYKKLEDHGVYPEDTKMLLERCKKSTPEERHWLLHACIDASPEGMEFLVYESLAMGKSYDQISRADYIPMKSDDFYGYRRKAMSKFYDFLRMYGRV